MPFYIKRNEQGQIIHVRYIFDIHGTEIEDYFDRGVVNVIALDGTPVTDEDRATVAEQFGHYLQGENQPPFPMD